MYVKIGNLSNVKRIESRKGIKRHQLLVIKEVSHAVSYTAQRIQLTIF